MTEEQQWYVQSGSRVQGPYTTVEVGRYLLLGRIRSNDRVSKDGELWEPVTQVPELIPEELLDLESDQGWEQFLVARKRLDERGEPTASIESDRRGSSPQEGANSIRDQWRGALDKQPRRRVNLLPISMFGVTVLVLLLVVFLNASGLQY